ncbi:MAG: hypothetical protein JJE47_14795 [Acidimicrobiia bacterium]|nr:hypothetical protein [Acidimicrobiia bacterium]
MTRIGLRALVVILVAGFIGIGSHHPAQACYCSQPKLSEAFNSPDTAVVVVGGIVGEMVVEGSFPIAGTLTIELSDVYRSHSLESPVRVRTAVGGSAACGFDSLPTEPSGFVLVPLESGELWTGSCEGSWTAEEVRSTALALGIERSGPIGADGNILAPTAGTPASRSVADNVERFQARWWIFPFVLIAFGVLLRRRQRDGAFNTSGDPADD